WSYMSPTEPSTNLKVYREQVQGGKTPEDAARETPSGKTAAAAGFTEVRIKSEGLEKGDEIGEGELYPRIRGAFTRAVTPPAGKGPGGPGGVKPPSTPSTPKTTTTTKARVTAGVTLA